MEELVRKANRGSFKKGRTAWNKAAENVFEHNLKPKDEEK